MYRAARATLVVVCSHQHGVRVGVATVKSRGECNLGVAWCEWYQCLMPWTHGGHGFRLLYGGVVLRPPWAKDLAPCSDYARDLPGTTHRLKSQTNPAPAATVQTRVTVTCREV